MNETKSVFTTARINETITTLSGGTRNKVNINRPWQTQLAPKPDCPFCSRMNQIDLIEIGEGYWKFTNKFTPYESHKLIIPDECWSLAKLYSLGGEDEIYKCLSKAMEETDDKMS